MGPRDQFSLLLALGNQTKLSTFDTVALVLSAAFLSGNGVIRRTQKVIQGDDNGHVGRPCLVLSAAFLRGNGVTRRTQKVIQGGDCDVTSPSYWVVW